MKQYDKIEYYNKIPFGLDCIAFDKLDGSNLRFEWGAKKGWYKFGTRNVMIDRTNEQFGIGIDIFLNKYGEKLDNIFRTKYKKVLSFVVFCEFYGDNSFAGQHLESDSKDVVLFDVNQYQKGIIDPFEFVDNFGELGIPKIIYKGDFNEELVSDIKNNKYNLSEGVIIKGIKKTKKSSEVFMAKIKTKEWLNKVKDKFGENYLLDELNGDQNLINEY
jgi:hypothetical protein